MQRHTAFSKISTKCLNPVLDLFDPKSTPNLRLRIQSFKMARSMGTQIARNMKALFPLVSEYVLGMPCLLHFPPRKPSRSDLGSGGAQRRPHM